ncbi:hypothetical protein GJ744_006384 [Endocarpon pusillum]|uniref:L domain-like protein n=1 Tax=Endocarpon pusillum TaxID=364733 RepID=A0A8H7E6Z5_9EURO|nr:hypothetical protein GJ744_006384 [Endocarpon pusillum]
MEQRPKPATSIPRLSRLPVLSGSVKKSVGTTTRKGVIPLVAKDVPNTKKPAQQSQQHIGNAARTEFTSGGGNQIAASEQEAGERLGLSTCLVTSSRDLHDAPKDTSSHDALLYETDERALATKTGPTPAQPETPRAKRKPRPSLSDRTVETLSQISPSPSSTRRKSSFFNAESISPMRPPLRPASAMGASRSRPSSPNKPPPVPSIPLSFVAKPNIRPLTSRHSLTQPARPSPVPPADKVANQPEKPLDASLKSNRERMSSKPAPTTRQVHSAQQRQSSSKPLSNKPVTVQRPRHTKPMGAFKATETKPTTSTPTTTSLSSYGSRRSSMQSLQSSSTEVETNANLPRKSFSKSSAALRGAITKAKQEAANRKASADRASKSPGSYYDIPSEVESGDGALGPKVTGETLRQRIRAALLSGHLFLPAMDLTSVPSEIEHMYDASEQFHVTWSECVNLTKFIAADNKFESLNESLFPDATNDELECGEGVDQNGQFRGLEVLDLHHNQLRVLPLGLRRLQKLRSLNLSRNKLGEPALDIICQIGNSLTDLKMSENELSGTLPENLRNLSNLQALDLHGNGISEFPVGIQELTQLKTLNLAKNKLSGVPCEFLANSTLVELNLSGNHLSGSFFPPQISSAPRSLKLLDVSNNALDAVSTAEVELLNVQTLNLNGNRIKVLPDISSWKELLTFTVAENLLCEVPSGLVMLQKLRNADLSNNNITKLDDGIALMEGLTSINLAGNPLCERKYLTLSTDGLKAALRKRFLVSEGPVETDVGPSISTSSSGGILDLSSKSMSNSHLPTQDLNSSVFELRLHHNNLNTIPASFLTHNSIPDTLKSLDLSHNPLQAPHLTSTLRLPQLKDLSLASCRLKSLDDLTVHLSAPSLTTLNLSINQLSGSLPRLRTYFPSLTTLFVADNRYSVLEVSAVQGLATLDIRNNDIGHLEPKLGLLGGKAGLKFLEVSGNRFRVPRWDVLNKGTEAVLRHLKGRVPLGELGDDSAVGGNDD